MQLMGLLDTDGPSIAPAFEEQINIDSDALPIESEHHITEHRTAPSVSRGN